MCDIALLSVPFLVAMSVYFATRVIESFHLTEWAARNVNTWQLILGLIRSMRVIISSSGEALMSTTSIADNSRYHLLEYSTLLVRRLRSHRNVCSERSSF